MKNQDKTDQAMTVVFNGPLITIITVCFNFGRFIEETINSILNQTYKNIEYIIIDGGSTDGTMDVIRKYDDRINYWISENDHGIYDAMNKGIEQVTGDWIIFMNAGDCFFDNFVLESIFNRRNIMQKVDIIYGNTVVKYPKKLKVMKAGNIDYIWKRSQFSHQSAFISSSYHRAKLYNIRNKIVADFEFFYDAYNYGAIFKYIDIIVSTVSSGGLSDIKRIDSIVGRWNIVEKKKRTNFFYIWLIIMETIKDFIKNFMFKARK